MCITTMLWSAWKLKIVNSSNQSCKYMCMTDIYQANLDSEISVLANTHGRQINRKTNVNGLSKVSGLNRTASMCFGIDIYMYEVQSCVTTCTERALMSTCSLFTSQQNSADTGASRKLQDKSDGCTRILKNTKECRHKILWIFSVLFLTRLSFPLYLFGWPVHNVHARTAGDKKLQVDIVLKTADVDFTGWT